MTNPFLYSIRRSLSVVWAQYKETPIFGEKFQECQYPSQILSGADKQQEAISFEDTGEDTQKKIQQEEAKRD